MVMLRQGRYLYNYGIVVFGVTKGQMISYKGVS